MDIKHLKSLSHTIYPQISLALTILKTEFKLVSNDMNILYRKPGYITNNFFELYCINPRIAIRNGSFSLDVERKLLNYYDKSLYDYLKLSVLERIGFYKSREGFPFKSFKKGIIEYKHNFFCIFLVIIISIVSITPKYLMLFFVACFVFFRHISLNKTISFFNKLKVHQVDNVLNAKSSDI